MNNKEASPVPHNKEVIKILNEKQIILENTKFKVQDLKKFIRKNKETLQEIIIRNCGTGYKRFETIHTLFLEADLLLIDITNLNKLEVENMQPLEEEKVAQYKDHMDNLYNHSLKNLKAEFNIHQMLRQNLNYDKTKIIIKQLSFDSKHAFYYSQNALLKYKAQIKCVSFVNILDMKINPMKAFCEKMRDLFELTEIQFINVLFSDQNILQIRYLLNWKQQFLERLVFKRIQMSEYQLQMLFVAHNFSLSDLVNLKELIFKCDEKLQKCQVYKTLLKKYNGSSKKKEKKQLQNPQSVINQANNIDQSKNKDTEEKDYQKQKLFEPKHIIIHNQLRISQFSSFQKELQQPLKILLFQLSQSNFCEELDISAISLIGAPLEIINYLIKSVCDSLSLHTLKIQNCQELINLLLQEFKAKNSTVNQETYISQQKKKKKLLAIQKQVQFILSSFYQQIITHFLVYLLHFTISNKFLIPNSLINSTYFCKINQSIQIVLTINYSLIIPCINFAYFFLSLINSEEDNQNNQKGCKNQTDQKTLKLVDQKQLNDTQLNGELVSQQIRSFEQLSQRNQENQDQGVKNTINSSSYVKVKKISKRKVLKKFIVEGNDHNIFGYSSLINTIQMMQYSEAVIIDFKDSILAKDGIKGILDGFELLKKRNDELEIKTFIIKNMKGSNQIDGQTWMKLGQNLFLTAGEYLEKISFDQIKIKESEFFEIMRGILSFKVKQMRIKVRSFIINKKTDVQMQIDQFLNIILQHLPLHELRVSSQVENSSFKINTNNQTDKTNNVMTNNKFYSHTLYSGNNVKSNQMSMSQCLQNENIQSYTYIPRNEINLSSCTTLKILQLNHFKQANWCNLIKNIVISYPKLEELDIAENGLNLDFLSFLILNSQLSNLTALRNLNLSKNPLKVIPFNPKMNQLQNSQLSIISGIVGESGSQKQINLKYQSPQNQHTTTNKQKINLYNSQDLGQQGFGFISKVTYERKQTKQNMENHEGIQEFSSIDYDKSENHKQYSADMENQSEDHLQTSPLDISKNLVQFIRNRQTSNVDEKNIKQLKLKSSDEKQNKKFDKVLNDFFGYIFKLEGLQYLDLSHTQMTNVEVEMIEHNMQIYKSSNLNFETINLNGNNEIRQADLFKKKIAVFEDAIQKTNNLLELTKIKQQNLNKIVSLKNISNITELNLSKCDINSDFPQKVIQILKLNQCQFQTINLSDNPNINENKWNEIITQIFTNQGRYLENLYLSNCKFKDNHIIEICKAVKNVCITQKDEILRKYEYGALQLNLLDLSHNPNIEKKEGWSQLIKTFFGSVLISLRSIYLRSCLINNTKSQYLLEGLQEANLELSFIKCYVLILKKNRKNSDICLRCLEQIDLRDNPIPLSLQIDLQKSFLLSNILQTQMSQIQEQKKDVIKKLQELDLNREVLLKQISKNQSKFEKPSATHISIGIESSNQMEIILPNVLRSFSYIDSLHIEKLTQGLDEIESEYRQKAQEEIEEMEYSNTEYEEKLRKPQFQRIQFRSVTLILNANSTRNINNSITELDQQKQRKSKFNKQKVKQNSNKRLNLETNDNLKDIENNGEIKEHNEPGSASFEQEQRVENGKEQEDENYNNEEQELVFNYEKHQQMKRKLEKMREEEDEYELDEKELNDKQIDPQIWESILTSLYNISQFEELIMKNCRLDGRTLLQICKIKSLISVDVSDNNYIYLVPADKSKLKLSTINQQNADKLHQINPFEGFDLLFNFQKIQEINLSNTNINSRFVKRFSQILQQSNQEVRDTLFTLRKINLSENTKLSRQDWQLLIKSLINNTTLQTLILKNCNIGKSNIQGIINALLYSNNTEYLQNIDLSYNKSIYPEEWGIVIVNLFNRYKIHSLNISYCAIYDQKLQSILKNLFINHMEHLEVLDFSGNYIENPENLFKFMNLLYQATNIKQIKFENCNLNKKNTEYFNDQVHLLQIRTLKTQSSLQKVYFSDNPMILESYCHSYTYFQTFLENSTQYFQSIQEIHLENCLTDQAKINSFIQCFISINSKGLKIRSLLTLNISGNRILGEQFSEMIPIISSVATSLQNLYLGLNTNKSQQQVLFKNQAQFQEQQAEQQTDQKPQVKPIQNSIQGIIRALQKINNLQLQKIQLKYSIYQFTLINIQISDDEEVTEEDWNEFLEHLFNKTGETLQHIMICGQRNMHIKESMFFSSLHKILRSKKYSNHFLRSASNKQKVDKIDLQIQSIGYFQKGINQNVFVLTGFNWPSFVKNGFQPEVESGHIIQLEKEEYDRHFWNIPSYQRSVYVKLHNDMSIMKFEETIQNDYLQNLPLKAELYIALNYLRQYLNCEQFNKQKFDTRMNAKSEVQAQLFLNINYNYSKLPIFKIPDVLRAPFQFREVDLTPILTGYENLTFDYPLYIFFIQACNLYPCDSIADFFVKFIKTLSTYYFSIDQGIFNMIQASPHFFLTEKDRDNIQRSMNKYKNCEEEEEDQQILKKIDKKPSSKSILQNPIKIIQPSQSIRKKGQSNRQQTYLMNSVQLNTNRPENAFESFNNTQAFNIANIVTQQVTQNLNQSRIINPIALHNQSSNQIQNDTQSIVNKTQIVNELSQLQLFPNKNTSERQPNRHTSQISFQNNNLSFQLESRGSIPKVSIQKKQATKAHQQKLEQQKKYWTVLCPYYFSSSSMNGVEEIQIIHRIQKMPPSELELKGMSISAIKTIYAFCFQNPYFTACQMDYHHSVFVNTSLAWSLREKIYKNYSSYKRNPLKNKIQKILFSTLRLMIRENVFYKYDNSAIMLDQYYHHKNVTHYMMMCLIIIYHFLTSTIPFIYSDKDGATRDSHFIYAAFSFVAFIVEFILVKDILGKILHLTPGLYVSGKSPTLIQSCFHATLINYKYIIFLWYLICSQFSRFNTYSDFCFLVLCLRNGSMTIFYLSSLILFINKGISFYRFIDIILKDEVKRKLPGYNITKFYETSIQLEFVAFSEVLDIISPYNVTRIPNNWITKLLMPQISGQSMNQRIYYQLLRILFEDLPQILVQITYLIGQIDILVTHFLIEYFLIAYVSLIMSFISFSLALYKIFSIRPSIISQLDFDELKVQKQSDHVMVLEEFEKNQTKMLQKIQQQVRLFSIQQQQQQPNSPIKTITAKIQMSPLKVPISNG